MSDDVSGTFAPFGEVEGYPALEDLGLIGDGATAALVARNGSVVWLCVPRFDAPPLFCSLLDRERGGEFVVAPEEITESRQAYVPDTGVLVTEMRGREGMLRLTDALTVKAGANLHEHGEAHRGELLRCLEAVDGPVRVRVELSPRGGATAERDGDVFVVRPAARAGMRLELAASRPVGGLRHDFELAAGERVSLALRWDDRSRGTPVDGQTLLDGTVNAWKGWLRCFRYSGPAPRLVRRAAITIKLLDYMATGAIVAAPTSSLPEWIGGVRNWDYRYAWIRDAAFSVYALRRIGMTEEAERFLRWVLDAADLEERPHILYDLDAGRPQPEWEDPELEGYRRSSPVRWGNAAADQRQHDVFGEILDCAYQWAAGGEKLSEGEWGRLRPWVEKAIEEWRTPDHGIWEVRTPGRVFTYSAALCEVALERGARLVERFGLTGDAPRWRKEAERIRQAILEEAWDPEMEALTEHIGSPGGLDASILALPLRRVIDARHPRMVATAKAVVERLGAGDGLIYRYDPEKSPDGLPGKEGAFLLCSFWLVDNLAYQGRLEEAHELFSSLCARTSPLGLLPEQVHPGSGEFLGNFPQAFSHLGLISSGFNLGRLDENGTRG